MKKWKPVCLTNIVFVCQGGIPVIHLFKIENLVLRASSEMIGSAVDQI
jgi:hypothetical protein